MCIIEAEKNLALYLAEFLNLEPDRQIFAGSFPDAVPEGISVGFSSGNPAALNRINRYSAVVRGRFRQRNRCRDAVDKIAAQMPVFGTAGFITLKMQEDVPVKFSDAENDGIPGRFEFELALQACYI